MTTPQEIPDYLKAYIVEQDALKYTPMDHASWRYILKISRRFFERHAHPLYVKGLEQTGISTERIPLISEIDERLRRFGWQAVAVSGFIPPAVFMEFLARGILPIACDMRKIENIAYTPAPDIVHEAAGHAPIIADPEYAAYLHRYGEMAEKAIFSKQDLEVYEGVRLLSDTKEDPRSTPSDIEQAQAKLDQALRALDHVSEATQLGRMGWWTIEYGLLGEPNDPRIYGAGLLSSVSESFNCLSPSVPKVPLTPECVEVSYDITKPQPRLFVAKNFQALFESLDQLGSRMAYKRGGTESLEKAKKARATTTTVLESGIQISGTLESFELDEQGALCFIKYSGPVQLCQEGREIEGQGPKNHPQGFSSPLGAIRVSPSHTVSSASELTNSDLKAMGFESAGEFGRISFSSGLELIGKLKKSLVHEGKNQVLTFDECTVRGKKGEVLFDPSWGVFDLACGSRVTSVFGWAADRSKYLEATGGLNQKPSYQKTNLTAENRALNELYAQVRLIRENPRTHSDTSKRLSEIHAELERSYPTEWLLRFELLELDHTLNLKSPWGEQAKERLAQSGADSPDLQNLIRRGMELLS